MKNIIALLVVIAVVIAGFYLWGANQSAEETSDMSDNADDDSAITTSAGMRAEENMVVVSEQRPGASVTGSIIYLAAPGYLIIHEDRSGEPGIILGASALLPAGESTGVKVILSRASKDGETLHAMLHFEKGGNATFTPSEDTPVQSRLGGPISGWFEVSKDASADIPISI
ncbi:hypothetical protein A3A38_03760 [Candidatus Kaiserbacteria bacterium RIFCSPLOWO2_01_FULL_53_17]|uniref:DUF7282 domain-containing protein n=1 Tax=Candidatus Kaiserbacteria bacterium RIFCSPLOWO2_01_FULL_53_17 TaxID=1798511 RepID=A0A1F6EGG9_9BACT|nr:MAG: hypothetical protein A3A38_03760 [Candidatus Kaiserbacteria bacterium RIFCSPLOWO2_01_FULL_53_17]